MLVVDHDKLYLEMMRVILDAYGFDVVTCDSRAKALDKLSGGLKADVLLTDYMMPERLDFPEFVARIRSIDKALPILLVSAYIPSLNFELVCDLKLDGYLPKPFDLKILGQTLRQVMRARKHALANGLPILPRPTRPL
ncbi:MAG: response regulator [Verrucomicrobiia bacterium]